MSNLIALAEKQQRKKTPDWLVTAREAAALKWQKNSIPGRKSENWKYLSLRSLTQGNYLNQNSTSDSLSVEELRKICDIPDFECFSVVFVNGHFNSELSNIDNLPSGVEIKCFSECHSSEVSDYLNSTFDSDVHPFAQLNSTSTALSEGLFVRLEKNACLEKPLHLIHVCTPQEKNYSVAPRILLVAEENSEMSIVEHFASNQEKQNAFTNAISEFVIKDNARLNYYRMHMEQENALHIGGAHFKLGKSAYLGGFFLSLGSELQRVDLSVSYAGEGAEAEIFGVYLPTGKQQVDYHTCIEHAVPHCTSNEVFRGIVSDSAKAVFNGRIHIHPDAQKTLAQLSNKNLLTSNKAEVDTKPELEIYADDVQCAHGATIAELDEKSMHYLRTRGVSEAEAKVMLSFGFINELIEKIKLEPLVNYLRPLLAKRFARNSDLARHLL